MSDRVTYVATFRVDLGQLLPTVGRMTDSMNKTMREFGFSEKLVIESETPMLEVSVSRALTGDELEKLSRIIDEQVHQRLPALRLLFLQPKRDY